MVSRYLVALKVGQWPNTMALVQILPSQVWKPYWVKKTVPIVKIFGLKEMLAKANLQTTLKCVDRLTWHSNVQLRWHVQAKWKDLVQLTKLWRCKLLNILKPAMHCMQAQHEEGSRNGSCHGTRWILSRSWQFFLLGCRLRCRKFSASITSMRTLQRMHEALKYQSKNFTFNSKLKEVCGQTNKLAIHSSERLWRMHAWPLLAMIWFASVRQTCHKLLNICI